MDCAQICSNNRRSMCPNFLLKRCEIPFTSMEPPFAIYNGWDNVTRHPLLNLMFACPNGDVFLDAINIHMNEQAKTCHDCHGFKW